MSTSGQDGITIVILWPEINQYHTDLKQWFPRWGFQAQEVSAPRRCDTNHEDTHCLVHCFGMIYRSLSGDREPVQSFTDTTVYWIPLAYGNKCGILGRKKTGERSQR